MSILRASDEKVFRSMVALALDARSRRCAGRAAECYVESATRLAMKMGPAETFRIREQMLNETHAKLSRDRQRPVPGSFA